MASQTPPPVHPLRQRWEAEHFPVDRNDDTEKENKSKSGRFHAYGQVTGISAATTTNELNVQKQEYHPEGLKRTSFGAKSYGSTHSRSEKGITVADAPSPLRGERRHGYMDDQQSTLPESISNRSSRHGRRPSLSEMAAPPPIDERKPPSDEETGSGSQEDLEARRKSEKQELAKPGHSPFLTDLYTISWLIFFSFWGTLARLGVEAITLYPSSPFPSRVLYANVGGSFVTGFLAEDRRLFRDGWGNGEPDPEPAAHLKVKKTLPLYIGISTGFCGCFTSFSSFMKDAFLALTNALESPSSIQPYHVNLTIPSRNGGFSFLALMAILIVHVAVSMGSLKTGAHFALLVRPITPVLPFRFFRRVIDPLAVVLAFGCWFGAIFLSIWPPGNNTRWRYRATFPLVFAPLGCLLRFYASKYLNARIPSFPLGTFAANIFGTAILGMAWDLQHARGIGSGPGVQTACSALQGVIEGFCGCLTTVSTWVLELDSLRNRHAWIYGLTSVGVGLGIMVVIMGSMGWTAGFATPSCS